MGSDTDRLPQLDEDPAEFIETIVLEDSDIMATREMRALINPDLQDSASEAEDEDDNT